MKALLIARKCPYCGDRFTPSRTNQPCCSSKICYARHKREWYEEYKALSVGQKKRPYVRKAFEYERLFDCTCSFCKSKFKSKTPKSTCCSKTSCHNKKLARKRRMSREWQQKHLTAQKVSSLDGRTLRQSLGKVSRSCREAIMEKWVATVFNLTDQIHLLFSECQHLRGSSSSLLESCMQEGTPLGCWDMHTLNRK